MVSGYQDREIIFQKNPGKILNSHGLKKIKKTSARGKRLQTYFEKMRKLELSEKHYKGSARKQYVLIGMKLKDRYCKYNN